MIGVAVAASLAIGSISSATADEFYERQLRAGKADFEARRVTEAANELRVAAFGFLDQPSLLAEALVRLAVAQNTLGLKSEVTKTLDRFVDVEQRFAPYKTLSIEPQIKSSFETLALSSLSSEVIATLPTLRRRSIDAEMQRIAALPERKRIAAYKALIEREPKNPDWPLALAREYTAREAFKEAVQWGKRALELEPGNLQARALVAHAQASSRACGDALPLMTDPVLKERPDLYADQVNCLVEAAKWSEAQRALANVPDSLKSRADVRQAAKVISTHVAPAPPPKPVSTAPKSSEVIEVTRKLNQDGKFAESLRRLMAAVETDPANRPLRLALLETAVLSKAYQTAAAQIPSVTPLSPGEELYMFYASVALYETGRKTDARPLMERARPHMVPNPMVDYYVRVILG